MISYFLIEFAPGRKVVRTVLITAIETSSVMKLGRISSKEMEFILVEKNCSRKLIMIDR